VFVETHLKQDRPPVESSRLKFAQTAIHFSQENKSLSIQQAGLRDSCADMQSIIKIKTKIPSNYNYPKNSNLIKQMGGFFLPFFMSKNKRREKIACYRQGRL
jgi:hypothetical protein